MSFSAVFLAVALAAGDPLTLQDVIDSVKRHYPPLVAALADRDVAAADLMAAEGRFDLGYAGRFEYDDRGYGNQRRVDTALVQPFAFGGMTMTGGYRATDRQLAAADTDGEFRFGLRLPLLRDRAIDSRRGELQAGRLGTRLADLSVDQQRLTIYLAAARRYWDWVAAGRRLEVTRTVLQIAETRQRLLEEGIAAGQLPAIEGNDNQRAILQRRSQTVEAERTFQATAIELSLFVRDDEGRPVMPTPDQLPPDFPDIDPLPDEEVRAGRDRALGSRPDVAVFGVQRDRLRLDAALARNSRTPALDVFAGVIDREYALSPTRPERDVQAGLYVEFPLQNRTARGRLRAAEARLRQLDQREQYRREQVLAEVDDATSALRAAFQRWEVLGEEVRVSQLVEDAERVRFDLGEGTLFMLNLREQATLDARVRYVISEADYQRALATYEATVGDLLTR